MKALKNYTLFLTSIWLMNLKCSMNKIGHMGLETILLLKLKMR